ncbi:MAG: TIGR00153 family protein [Phycisphaerales bacterium]|nr:MAG: TIGR00153 family protein [Phycisphaerales bacterium]
MGFRELFSESPFEPLRQHMDKVKETVDLLRPMFERVRDKDYQGLEEISKRVFKLEHQADQIKTEIRRTIPTTFFLPVYRGDLLSYLKLQDNIADSVENLAVLLTIKKLELPEKLAPDVLALVDKVLEVYQSVYEITGLLRELTKAGLEGEGIGDVLDKVSRAELGEWEADKVQYALARKLFALEEEMRATDVFLWSNIFTTLGKLANHAEKTGDRIRRMLTT